MVSDSSATSLFRTSPPPSGTLSHSGLLPVARALQAVLLVMFVVFAVSTIPGVRSGPGFVVWLDGWFQGTAYVLIALLAVLRPIADRSHRLVCSLVAGSLVLRVLAFLWFWSVVRVDPTQPYPSPSDVGWILSGLLLLVALGLRTGDFAPLVSRTLLLDAVAGALLVAGVVTAAAYPLMLRLARPGIPADALAVNLAYPLLDIAVLIAATGLLAVGRWRPRGPEAALVVGVVLFAVIDVTYLYELTRGTFHPGTWLGALSFLAMLAIASAGWWPGSTERAIVTDEIRTPGLSVPVTVSLLAVAVLAYAGVLRLASVRVAELALLLLVLAVVCAVARGVRTVTQDRVLLGATHEELVRFEALVQNSGDFIGIAGVDGRLLYLNPAGRRMVGLGPDEDVRSTTIDTYLTEEGRRRAREVSGPAIRTRGEWSGESVLRHVRGGADTPVAVNTFAVRYPGSGELVAIATIQRDIAGRQKRERELRTLADQRRMLISRLVAAQEDERASIAEDVHDDSVQALAAVELRLGLLRRQLQDTASEAALDTVDKAHATVVEATTRLRHLLFDLESPARETDLLDALRTAAEHVFEESEVRWEVVGEDHVDLPEEARVTAYRVVKEALTNVLKHSGASRVVLRVERGEVGGVVVAVEDDGRGFDGEDVAGHQGMGNMRDRATIAGGELEVDSDATGTRVRLWLPLAPGDLPA